LRRIQNLQVDSLFYLSGIVSNVNNLEGLVSE